MATSTRFPTTTIGADVDVVAAISLDRIHLRFCFGVCPCVYLWEDAEKTVHKLNAAGQWDVEYVGAGEYQFWPTLAKVFEMEQAALAAVRADTALSWDSAQTTQVEALRDAAVAEWDAQWAAYDQAVADAQAAYDAAYAQWELDHAAWTADPQDDPEPPPPTLVVVAEPTLDDLAAEVWCVQITGPGPFVKPNA